MPCPLAWNQNELIFLRRSWEVRRASCCLLCCHRRPLQNASLKKHTHTFTTLLEKNDVMMPCPLAWNQNELIFSRRSWESCQKKNWEYQSVAEK